MKLPVGIDPKNVEMFAMDKTRVEGILKPIMEILVEKCSNPMEAYLLLKAALLHLEEHYDINPDHVHIELVKENETCQ